MAQSTTSGLPTAYAFSKELPGVSPEDAVERVTGVLKESGFGVLTKIDVQSVFEKKLGVEFGPYAILGACNPKLAHKALQGDPEIGLLLPCNVVVRGGATGALVSFADPRAMFALVPDSPLEDIANEAHELLRAAFDRL